MTCATQVRQAGASCVVRYGHHRPEVGPPWLTQLREAAYDRFTKLGFPTRRMEEWRFLNVSPIADRDFAIPSGEGPKLSPSDVETFMFPGLRCHLIVFVNGRYHPQLSKTDALPHGTVVLELSEASRSHPDLVQPHLARYAEYDNNAFTALNTAMLEEGLFVHVPKGKDVEEPIHVLHVTVPQDEAQMSSPRVLVVADASSRVTIVEHFAALGEGAYFTNAVTEVVLGDNAEVTRYMLEREGPSAFNVSSLHTYHGRDSRLSSHTVLLGGAITRNNIVAVLDGDNCWSQLNGLYVVGADHQVDNHMRVVHVGEHGKSRQYYRGVMNDRSRGIFRGRIVVQPHAQKTDAVQSNQNLLLSDDASINSDPQLEIYADDVKCTHGSTTGQVDENAIFYLQARGISEEVARAMLVYAFAAESLDRMTIEPIREHLRRVILKLVPCAAALKDFL